MKLTIDEARQLVHILDCALRSNEYNPNVFPVIGQAEFAEDLMKRADRFVAHDGIAEPEDIAKVTNLNTKTKYVRVSELAVRLSISKNTIWRLVREGEFPEPIKLGRKITAWKESDVHEWMNRMAEQPIYPKMNLSKKQ